MKHLTLAFCISFLCSTGAEAQNMPKEKSLNELSRVLKDKDSLIFDIAFKTGDVKRLYEIYAKEFIMFYDHGLSSPTTSQSFADFEQRLKNSAEQRKNSQQPALRRVVVPGTMQVFPVSESIATQTGVQQFFLRQQEGKEIMVEESKFLRHWTKKGSEWRISTETDYLVNTNPQASLLERYKPENYVPASHALYDTIVRLDSIYFDTYNNCKLALMDSLTAEDVEFYHDRGGLSTSKKELLESIQKNICGKVTRVLTKNSIEVYEIPGYGAVQFGYHSFRNIAEQGESRPSKFVTLWRLKNGQWQMARVISLH